MTYGRAPEMIASMENNSHNYLFDYDWPLTSREDPALREPDHMVKMMDLVTDNLETVRAHLKGWR